MNVMNDWNETCKQNMLLGSCVGYIYTLTYTPGHEHAALTVPGMLPIPNGSIVDHGKLNFNREFCLLSVCKCKSVCLSQCVSLYIFSPSKVFLLIASFSFNT
uniref:Uncharacterized protein n=1 Tax=Cacopsylla melanoneura TaxID=428564 RepID=A0A8D8W8A5_9HEMI